VTELVSTVTGPKLVPKTLEESLLVNTVAKLAALVALLSRKATESVTTTEPPVTLTIVTFTGLPVKASMLVVKVLMNCTCRHRTLSPKTLSYFQLPQQAHGNCQSVR